MSAFTSRRVVGSCRRWLVGWWVGGWVGLLVGWSCVLFFVLGFLVPLFVSVIALSPRAVEKPQLINRHGSDGSPIVWLRFKLFGWREATI